MAGQAQPMEDGEKVPQVVPGRHAGSLPEVAAIASTCCAMVPSLAPGNVTFTAWRPHMSKRSLLRVLGSEKPAVPARGDGPYTCLSPSESPERRRW